MKLTDKFINKYGYDKVLHFVVAALITSLVISTIQTFDLRLVSLVVGYFITGAGVFVLSWLKEGLDDKRDIGDINAASFGWIAVGVYQFVLVAIGMI